MVQVFVILSNQSFQVAESDDRGTITGYPHWGSARPACTTTGNMGVTGICEILIVTLLIVSMVVPLAVVLIVTELITRRRVLRRDRVCNSQPFNIHALANL